MGRIKLAGLAASALALGVMATPAQAQFGGILGGAARGAASSATTASSDDGGCSNGRRRSGGSRVLGGILGGAASGAAGQIGGVLSYVPVAELTDQISSAIACKLDPDEQKQAADATVKATRSDSDGEAQVGDMVAWRSATRDDVSGTSTVVALDDGPGRGRGNANGLQCITVADVIIVNGEETRADKRMCRQPPAARYAIAQA
jgi:surface antigen